MFEIPWWLFTMLGIFVWFLSLQAGRLDRLHHRIDVAQRSLDGHLTRRAGIAAELVALNFLDPASEAHIVQSAHEVLVGPELPAEQRLQDEAELTRALAQAFADSSIVAEFRSDPAINQLLTELVGVTNRIALARRFHTEAVKDCQAIREQSIVRIFRLAGRAAQPKAIDLSDGLPIGLLELS
jgi:hypothetical protein